MFEIRDTLKDLVFDEMNAIFVEVKVVEIVQAGEGTVSNFSQMVVVQQKRVKALQIFKGSSRNVTDFVESQISRKYNATKRMCFNCRHKSQFLNLGLFFSEKKLIAK